MDDIEDQGKEIELRSEEVQEVLGRVPSWILRYGLFLVAIFVVFLLVGSFVYKTPEMIQSILVLTSDMAPVEIAAKVNGRILEIHVSDQQNVKKGECIAVLQNDVSYMDVLHLEKEIKNILLSLKSDKVYTLNSITHNLQSLQPSFASLQSQLDTYNKFKSNNYYAQKLRSIKQLITANEAHFQNVSRQKKQALNPDESGKSGVDKSGVALLARDNSNQNMQSTLDNINIQILQMKEALLDVDKQYQEKKNALLADVQISVLQMQKDIASWKLTNLLTSPIDGKIQYSSSFGTNHDVMAGDVLFTVASGKPFTMFGKSIISADRSGKVKVGQKVNVHFVNYPNTEYGVVVGVVKRISWMPTNGKYSVLVGFPNDLTTTYGKKLPYLDGMTGNADIITDELRLIDQLFMPIKKILRNNL